MSKRIFYLQYTNPAAYPPLLHSMTILADAGWDVLALGIDAAGVETLAMPQHERIRYQRAGGPSGGRLGPLKYTQFVARCVAAAIRFRPDWCYASDALSAPAANAVRAAVQTRLVYHEHDAPATAGSRFQKLVGKARAQVVHGADVVIAPSAARLELLPHGHGQRFVVWNCPRRSEAGPARAPRDRQAFRMVYHGSLSRDRLTPAFIDALALLPSEVELHLIGYETVGHRGYVQELQQRAQAAGVGERLRYHGPVARRSDLLEMLREFDLGISTVSAAASDRNLETLAGASNKAFEYLAGGTPILISAIPAWQKLYEAPGYAVVCDPASAASVADAVSGVMMQPDRGHAMGEAGRQRILAEWNYDVQFAPVMAVLSA